MIRAFICSWQFIPERMEVINPIAELDVPCRMYYADADANGLPDGQHVLVFVDAPEIDGPAIAAAAGAYMFPPYAFNTPMVEVSQAVKDEVLTLCTVQNWMPTEALFLAATYGDCLKLLAKHFSAGFISFGNLETARAGEFG